MGMVVCVRQNDKINNYVEETEEKSDIKLQEIFTWHRTPKKKKLTDFDEISMGMLKVYPFK